MNAMTAAFEEFRESLQHLGEYAGTKPLSDEEAISRAKRAFAAGLDGHLALDLETCIHCGMCAEACHFYEATEDPKYSPVYKFRLLRRFYRREMSPMRWLYRPFTRDIKADDLETWAELVYESCTGCGRCDMMCPMGINLSRLIDVTREGLADAGYIPTELRALQEEQEEHGTIFGVGTRQFLDRVEELRADGVEMHVDRDQADILLLSTAQEVMLFPRTLAASAKILNMTGADWTLRSDAFEASNLGLVSGDTATQRAVTRNIVAVAKSCGAKTVLVPESGHAYQALRWEAANELGEELPFEVLALSEYVDQKFRSGALTLREPRNGETVTYHDPCRLGRHSGVLNEPRHVLTALGFSIRDTSAHRRDNHCCGGGCAEYVIKRAANVRQRAWEIKRREFDATGAKQVVTSCENCRINLMIGAENAGWETPITSFAETIADRLAD